VLGGPPFFDLDFHGLTHGALVRGGPQWMVAEVYRTDDGGSSWTPLQFSP
jgi:hypothetical protein